MGATTTYRLTSTKGTREITGSKRTAEQWWTWHDADYERVSSEMAEAEERCRAWVAGESEDGPSDEDLTETVAEIRDGVDVDADEDGNEGLIEVQLDSPVGPRVLYADGVDAEEIDALLPAGWQAEYSSQVRTDSGAWSAPLVLDECTEIDAQKLAKRVLEGRDTTVSYRDAGYATALDAARGLVGSGGAVAERAAEIVAEAIEHDGQTMVPRDQVRSTGIRVEMERQGITEAELLGEYGEGDARITLYRVGDVRVVATNGDPIWEEADIAAFADLLAEYGVEGC